MKSCDVGLWMSYTSLHGTYILVSSKHIVSQHSLEKHCHLFVNYWLATWLNNAIFCLVVGQLPLLARQKIVPAIRVRACM
jgi:hypothetical protein